MNPFLRYLADKNSAHRQTHRQTHRHTPMTTIPDGLRRAGNNRLVFGLGAMRMIAKMTQYVSCFSCSEHTITSRICSLSRRIHVISCGRACQKPEGIVCRSAISSSRRGQTFWQFEAIYGVFFNFI